jgi:hypothetical protein
VIARFVVVAVLSLFAYPRQPVARVLAAAWVAAEVGVELRVSPAILVAVAEHESDLEPCAVSFRAAGRRVDVVAPRCWVDPRWPRPYVCGYLQAMYGDANTCGRAMRLDGAMRAGALELLEWAATCRGDAACVLRGHAGGTACALDARACTGPQLAFAQLFAGRAMSLGWRGPTIEE